MEISTCIRCGSLFRGFSSSPVCPACWLKADQEIHEVEEYVTDNRQAGFQEVAGKCHVREGNLKRWLNTDRIHFSETSALKIPCERCGTPIHSGRLCESCLTKKRALLQGLTEEFQQSGKPADPPRIKKRVRDEMFTARNRH